MLLFPLILIVLDTKIQCFCIDFSAMFPSLFYRGGGPCCGKGVFIFNLLHFHVTHISEGNTITCTAASTLINTSHALDTMAGPRPKYFNMKTRSPVPSSALPVHVPPPSTSSSSSLLLRFLPSMFVHPFLSSYFLFSLPPLFY